MNNLILRKVLLIEFDYSIGIHIRSAISTETCEPLTCKIDKMLLINVNDNTNNRIIFS